MSFDENASLACCPTSGENHLNFYLMVINKIIPRAGGPTKTNQISFSRVADRCISPPGVVVDCLPVRHQCFSNRWLVQTLAHAAYMAPDWATSKSYPVNGSQFIKGNELTRLWSVLTIQQNAHQGH